VRVKNQFFGNKSGKPQPIQTKFTYVLIAQLKGRQCLGNVGAIGPLGAKLGLRWVPCSRQTRWHFVNFSTADFQQIFPQHVNPRPIEKYRKWFSKMFLFRRNSPPPKKRRKTQNWGVSNRYLTLTSPQPRGCSPRERENFLSQVSVFLYDIQFLSCGASNSTIFVFCLFFPYKMPKYFCSCGLQPRDYGPTCKMLPIIPRCSERPKRVTFANAATSDGGAGISKVAQMFVYRKCLWQAFPIDEHLGNFFGACIYTMLLHGASDLDQRGLRTRHSA